MIGAMKLAHDKALLALNQAKALREQHKASGMPADVNEQFNKHMADFEAASTEYHALKNQEEKFASLEKGLEDFTAPAGEAFYANPELTKTAAPAEQNAAA